MLPEERAYSHRFVRPSFRLSVQSHSFKEPKSNLCEEHSALMYLKFCCLVKRLTNQIS